MARAGGLLASADDMALYMKHLFRTTAGTVAAGAGPQIMDGTTVSESLASQVGRGQGATGVRGRGAGGKKETVIARFARACQASVSHIPTGSYGGRWFLFFFPP